MKKIICLVCILALMCAMTVTAFATEGGMRVRSSELKEGELVYITVELTQSVEGNGIGLSYTYDENYLKPVISSCSWVRSSMMQNFDPANATGVWADTQKTDLKGGVCVLAFELLKGLNFNNTSVECSLRVKNGSKLVGEYTADTKLIAACDHSYGTWSDLGLLGHGKTCTKCGAQQTESHAWDEGVTSLDGSGNSVFTKTCQVCKAKNVTQTGSKPDATTPSTEPVETETVPGPQTVKPETDKETVSPDRIPPTQPDSQKPQTQKPDTGSQEIVPEHNHDHTTGATTPENEQDDDEQSQPDEEKQETSPVHDHVHTVGAETQNPVTVIVVVVAVIALIGAVVYFVKKRK